MSSDLVDQLIALIRDGRETEARAVAATNAKSSLHAEVAFSGAMALAAMEEWMEANGDPPRPRVIAR